MTAYTVHEPAKPSGDALKDSEGLVFVKDGFAWLAFLIPALWLLWQRMWLVLLGYLGLALALGAATNAVGVDQALAAPLSFGINLLLGFEGHGLRRWTLARRGYREVGLAHGRTREEAEIRFFESWLRARRGKAEASEAEPSPAGHSGGMPWSVPNTAGPG